MADIVRYVIGRADQRRISAKMTGLNTLPRFPGDSVIGCERADSLDSSSPAASMDLSQTLVIFDLDGTLVDAFEDIAFATNYGLETNGLPTHDLATVKTFVGDGISHLVARAVGSDKHPKFTKVLADVKSFFADHCAENAKAYPQVVEMLSSLREQGAQIATLSNKPDAMVHTTLTKTGLDELIDLAMGETEEYGIKPDPAGLQALVSKRNRRNVIMIGDGIPDAQVAQNASIPFVGVSWGLTSLEKLREFNPIGVADSALGLIEILQTYDASSPIRI